MNTKPTPIEGKRADPMLQLGIDEAILEYLSYKATKAVLRDSRKPRDNSVQTIKDSKCAVKLDLVDSFLVIFRTMHPDYQCTQELQLRLRLLRFATLFTKRKSIKALKSWTQDILSLPERREKANNLKSTSYAPDLTGYLVSSEDLEKIKQGHEQDAKVLSNLESNNKTSLPVVSLLDTLPSFMALSAAENMLQESKITDTWMRLAAGYMAQAVIEQYLLYGSQSDKIMNEAFAWGFDLETGAGEGSQDWIVNAMFLDEEAEFESWQEIKHEHIQALVPPEGRNLLDHFVLLRKNELSLFAFEHTMATFLEGLLHSLPGPSLVQMGSGNFEDDLPAQHDTPVFKERVGLRD